MGMSINYLKSNIERKYLLFIDLGTILSDFFCVRYFLQQLVKSPTVTQQTLIYTEWNIKEETRRKNK